MLKKKVLKQNNLLRLQKRLAVVMLALTLGLGTGCGKTDDGADGVCVVRSRDFGGWSDKRSDRCRSRRRKWTGV
ncbi:MAG: hypothetical protein ACLR1E_07640 [Coprococcus sp.]